MEKTLSVSVLSQLIRYLESVGIDYRSLMQRAGMDPSLAESPDGRIPVEIYLAVEQKAVDETRDPCFGLHVGQFYKTGSWSLVDYMIMNCQTLEDALLLSGKYGKIVSYLIQGSIRLKPGCAEMIHYVPKQYPQLSPHCYYTFQTSLVQMMRQLTGQPVSPVEIGFAIPEPSPAVRKEFEDWFRCPVLFGRKHYSTSFDMRVGQIPVLQPDPLLLKHFEELGNRILQDLERSGTVTEAVTKLVVSRLKARDITINRIAREMAMSVRTLQNRLADEGTVFSSLVSDTRRQLACRWLEEKRTVEEITFLLGFSDTSAFRKAFRKWTGITAGEYRKFITGERHNTNIY
jgi:AraC-like DNA-binding protein